MFKVNLAGNFVHCVGQTMEHVGDVRLEGIVIQSIQLWRLPLLKFLIIIRNNVKTKEARVKMVV